MTVLDVTAYALRMGLRRALSQREALGFPCRRVRHYCSLQIPCMRGVRERQTREMRLGSESPGRFTLLDTPRGGPVPERISARERKQIGYIYIYIYIYI
jgi:hypothetical protein